jgi:DeoR/GlpR family transcriptional regulator of sugar metabolism
MPTPNLLLDERHRFIRERLARQGRAPAVDLARELGTSEDTIRRDLRELASLGACAVVLAATSDKLGVSAHFAVAPAANVDHLVVEADATDTALAPFERLGIRVHRAEPW